MIINKIVYFFILIINSQKMEKILEDHRESYKMAKWTGIKRHRTMETVKFLEKCKSNKILPKFTMLKKETIQQAKMNDKQITKIRNEKLNEAIITNENRLRSINQKFYHFLEILEKSSESKRKFIKIKYKLNNEIKNFEMDRDKNRQKIFANIKLAANDNKHAKIEIFNSSGIFIPKNILDILSLGIKLPVGGKPNSISILSKFETFFQDWSDYARSNNIDEFEIIKVKTKLLLKFFDFRNCYADSSNIKTLTKFFNEHDNLIIMPIDKSKNIEIMLIDDYIKKLRDIFDNEKFIKCSKNPFKVDIRKFKEMIKELEQFIGPKKYKHIQPKEGLKSGYGILKKHKINEPLRPIISSINSITTGLEEYFLEIIKPIVNNNCEYSVESTKTFKKLFLEKRKKYNQKTHDVISFDAKSLFTSINVPKTIKYICDKIYSEPEEYFPKVPKNGENTEFLPHPPRPVFEKCFNECLTEFSGFSTLNGYYKQKSGVSMGSKLSPALANIFCTIMEEQIIKKYMGGKVIAYFRYVDDILVIGKKGSFDNILKEMNNFDENLNFVLQPMINNSLIFLDTEIYVDDNGILQFKKYQKPSASDVILNFSKSITPKKYKISTLSGEIFRCNYTNTTDIEREKALKKLKIKFLKNNYPEKLINTKITEIKNREFKPSEFRAIREKNITDNPEKFSNISIPYTDHRCAKIAQNIIRIIKNITPDFNVNFCWSNITLDRIFSPKLKLKKPLLEQKELVYEFECVCGEKYLGETKQQLKNRIYQHGYYSQAIKKHIEECQTYQANLNIKINEIPTYLENDETIKFFESRFKIIHTNLSSTNDRKICEGLYIKLFKPKLNEQVVRRAIQII